MSRHPREATTSTTPCHHARDARWREGPSAWLLDRWHGGDVGPCRHGPRSLQALGLYTLLLAQRFAPTFHLHSRPPSFLSFFTPGRLCGHHDVLSWPSADPLFPTCSWTRPRSLLTLLGTPLCRLFAAPFRALIPGRETTLEGTAPKIPKANPDPAVRWI